MHTQRSAVRWASATEAKLKGLAYRGSGQSLQRAWHTGAPRHRAHFPNWWGCVTLRQKQPQIAHGVPGFGWIVWKMLPRGLYCKGQLNPHVLQDPWTSHPSHLALLCTPPHPPSRRS